MCGTWTVNSFPLKWLPVPKGPRQRWGPVGPGFQDRYVVLIWYGRYGFLTNHSFPRPNCCAKKIQKVGLSRPCEDRTNHKSKWQDLLSQTEMQQKKEKESRRIQMQMVQSRVLEDPWGMPRMPSFCHSRRAHFAQDELLQQLASATMQLRQLAQQILHLRCEVTLNDQSDMGRLSVDVLNSN